MISLVFMALYYGICLFSLSKGGCIAQMKELRRELSLWQRAVIVLVAAAGVLLTAYWMQQNRFVYFWDFGGYWNMSIQWTEFQFSHNLLETLIELFASINRDDYNYLLPAVIALPMKVSGYSFSTYVLINHVMFLIPAVLVQALCAVKLVGGNGKKGWIFVIAVVLGTLFPPNYYAMYLGYIDAAILLPISAAIYLLTDFDFQKPEASKDAALALTLVIAWLCRRYVIFFIIGYVAALAAKGVILLGKKRDLRTLGGVVKHFCIIGGISIGVLLVYFNQFFFRAILTDFRELYSAYDAHLPQKFSGLADSFGAVTVAVAAVGGILCFVMKKNRANLAYLLTLMVVETAAFWKTQNMGVQHRLLLNVPLFLCCMLVWTPFVEYFNGPQGWKQVVEKGSAIVCSLALAVNFYQAMIPAPPSGSAGWIFSEQYAPLRRDDIDQLERLVQYLNEETVGTEKWVYVAASGFVLNHDILRKVHLPETRNAVNNLYLTNDVDLRDGFPDSFLAAEYVVTTDPVQLHLASGQEVVRYPAEMIQDESSYIGQHFIEISQFELDEGVTAKVYYKASDWDQSDLEQMKDYFNGLYPGHEDIFGGRIP